MANLKFQLVLGSGWLNEFCSWITHTSLSPIRHGFAPSFV